MPNRRAFVIAVLGAESTGKTTLARGLGRALGADEGEAVVVTEYLREFCDARSRTPLACEQSGIADIQTRRIAAAAAAHPWVIADTTALMTAVYSDQVFGDASLYAQAMAAHLGGCDLTLLTGLDLPWQADGRQRDGPQVREPVDARLRAALESADAAFSVVLGTGGARLNAAMAAVQRRRGQGAVAPGAVRWQWHCERCGEPGCERGFARPRGALEQLSKRAEMPFAKTGSAGQAGPAKPCRERPD